MQVPNSDTLLFEFRGDIARRDRNERSASFGTPTSCVLETQISQAAMWTIVGMSVLVLINIVHVGPN